MGLERRGNGIYYYQKRREGGRVVSRYVGAGMTALWADGIVSGDRAEAAERRAQEEIDIARLSAVFEQVLGFSAAVDAALCEAMASAGYRRHNRGEWRKTREAKR